MLGKKPRMATFVSTLSLRVRVRVRVAARIRLRVRQSRVGARDVA